MVSVTKWVGGKSKLSSSLLPLIKTCITETTYIEPFLGSGAIAFNLIKKNILKEKQVILNDKCKRLMNYYHYIMESPEEIIDYTKELQLEDINDDIYKQYRDEFNTSQGITNASLFLWINLSCYNGMYRENKQGKFNIPYGKKSSILESVNNKFESIRELSLLLNSNDITLLNEDYEVLYQQYNNSFWYLDPPYYNSFNQYVADGFDDIKFWMNTKLLNETNVWVMSNSGHFLDLFVDDDILTYPCESLDIKYSIRPQDMKDSKELVVLSSQFYKK